jgi:hypothetical protein
LKYEDIPDTWKTSTTVLIYKKGDTNDITNWRPIAIMRTIYKLFAGVLAKRITTWLDDNSVLASAQKGFMPYDEVYEHNYILRRLFNKARTENGEFIATWLDFSNAFGSVPHEAIVEGLNKIKAGNKFIKLIKNMYRNTEVLTNTQPTNDINIESGIKQGCPISGLLFNIAIDPIIRNVQGDDNEQKILAYADDLVLLSNNKDDMQKRLDETELLARRINIKINPTKSFSMHLYGVTPVGTRDTTFHIQNQQIRSLRDGEIDRFLGMPVGFQITRGVKEESKRWQN